MMGDELSTQLQSVLWDDFAAELDFPNVRPLLAHYTSVITLERIVLSGEIWFSNPLFMNDWEELRFGMNAGAKEFRTHPALVKACKTASAHAALVEAFDRYFSAFDNDHAIDTYILCLSEHSPENDDGILSMWRGYGANGGGVAVVFDLAKINDVENSPFVVGRVHYASTSQRLAWIDTKITALAKVIEVMDKAPANLQAVAFMYLERLKLFSLFTKHDGFAEEREWRIVYFSDRDKARALVPMLGYSVTSRGVEPKLRVKLAELPPTFSEGIELDNLVERILLGPSISTVLAEKSLRRMLTLAKHEALAEKVVGSSIPFRAYTG